MHLELPVAAVTAHTGKVPIVRLSWDLDYALARGRNAADLLIAGRDKDRYSGTTADLLTATGAEGTGCGCSLPAKTLLETIGPYQCLAASEDSSETGSVGCSSSYGHLQTAHRTHSAPGFDSLEPENLVASALNRILADKLAAT